MTRGVSLPFEAVEHATDRAGDWISEKTDSPLLGSVTKTGLNAIPMLFLRGARGAKGKAPATSSETMAREYAQRNGMDWDSLAPKVQEKLTTLAQDAKRLDELDPDAVRRQAQLESLPAPVPATSGQVTRDATQLRNEGNISAAEVGMPIREIYEAQNAALLENLDILKGRVRGSGKTASVAESPEQVGANVQGTLRAKLDAKRKEVSDLYDKAEAAGELQGAVSPRPLAELIEASPDLTHLGWVDSWLNKLKVRKNEGAPGMDVESMRNVSLKELEDLRQAAVAKAMNGGTDGYYASKVIRAIDSATEGAGGSVYKAARKARREQALEFEDQWAIAELVKNDSRTDRSVALEKTWNSVVKGGSLEDLRKVGCRPCRVARHSGADSPTDHR
jgi:hypothetical protein